MSNLTQSFMQIAKQSREKRLTNCYYVHVIIQHNLYFQIDTISNISNKVKQKREYLCSTNIQDELQQKQTK